MSSLRCAYIFLHCSVSQYMYTRSTDRDAELCGLYSLDDTPEQQPILDPVNPLPCRFASAQCDAHQPMR
eukprot:scaffold108377_cov78-Phaeocystis_antarctica.AAC.1